MSENFDNGLQSTKNSDNCWYDNINTTTKTWTITKQCLIFSVCGCKNVALAIMKKHLSKTWSGQSVWLNHCCMHTARLSGVPCSCCFVHIARWIGNRRFHTAWPYNRKNRQQLCLVRKLHFTTKWEGNNARSQFSCANGNVNKMVAQK